MNDTDRIVAEIDRAQDEIVELTRDLVRIPTVNPPGAEYAACAHLLVEHLAECGRIARGRTDYVIIPEPLNVDRICVGHRGVYWFELTTRGRIAHGSMPFLGVSAIDGMSEAIAAIRRELEPALAKRVTSMPVVPDRARHATININ